ncbi:MAG: phytanoyl-CoA dioxygenase family protein [Caldilineaceae bacterium]
MKQILSDVDIAFYQQNGYVIVPELIEPAVAHQWKAALKTRLMEEDKLHEPSGVRVWMCDRMDPVTVAQVQSPKLLAILQQLIGPDIEFLSVKAVFKNAQTTFNSPWHQDWWYWRGSNKVSIWIALDEATPENGCLRLIPGSQRQVFDQREVEDGKGFGHRLLEEDVAQMNAINAPVPCGGAIFFHDLALHGSCPNVNGQDRWSVIPTYRNGAEPDASTVWARSLLLSGTTVN